ncbi:hypothetical protein BC830DRAFT_1140630 [Chytriomyces sp. MP71]|nr:hypothetical protein BC830DRAFT_1140630 [Chytriomyces sp. MP71]
MPLTNASRQSGNLSQQHNSQTMHWSRWFRKPTQLLPFLVVFCSISLFTNFKSWIEESVKQVLDASSQPTNLPSSTTIPFAVTLLHDYPGYPISTNITRGSLIPNQILRTWKTNNRLEIRLASANKSDHPDRFKWFETWDGLNSGQAVQILFNDADMDNFVRGSFSRRVVEAYFKLPRVVLRADFARYMMLYELGGYYADMDVSCTNPIRQWNLGLDGVAVIVGVENPSHEDKDSVLQWAMASARHHPFMAMVIQRVTDKIHSASVQELMDVAAVLDITGPGIWKQVVWEYLASQGVDMKRDRNLWVGYKQYGDFLLLGKAYLNNDNSDNPVALIRHHFTGFSEYGWRQEKPIYANDTLAAFEKSAATARKNKTITHISEAQLDADDAADGYRQIISRVSAVAGLSTREVNIPKVIVQVCNTSAPADLSVSLRERRESWVRENPDYQILLMSDADVDAFMRGVECTSLERDAYFWLPRLMWRIEFFKLVWMVKRGGVYADIDTQCHVGVDKWNYGKKNAGLTMGFKAQHHDTPEIFEHAFAAVKNHPLLVQYLSLLAENILSQHDIRKNSFHQLFRDPINKFMATEITKHGIDPKTAFKNLDWHGYAEFDDVIIHGNERFTPASGNIPLAYVRRHAELWNNVWREETEAVSKATLS